MMNALIQKLALEWLTAEDAARRERGEEVDPIGRKDAIEIASDRVYQVLAGEVRWSEASPGDRAIWRGRFRDVEMFERMWTGKDDVGPGNPSPASSEPEPQIVRLGGPPRLHGVVERLWWNWYDTLQWTETVRPMRSQRLFGNSNVGNLRLCNLQVAGMLGFDSSQVITRAYVATTRFASLEQIADATFQLVIGDKRMTPPMFVRDLVMGVSFAIPLVVPVRHNVSVMFDCWRDYEGPPFELAFHLEGISDRSVQ